MKFSWTKPCIPWKATSSVTLTLCLIVCSGRSYQFSLCTVVPRGSADESLYPKRIWSRKCHTAPAAIHSPHQRSEPSRSWTSPLFRQPHDSCCDQGCKHIVLLTGTNEHIILKNSFLNLLYQDYGTSSFSKRSMITICDRFSLHLDILQL